MDIVEGPRGGGRGEHRKLTILPLGLTGRLLHQMVLRGPLRLPWGAEAVEGTPQPLSEPRDPAELGGDARNARSSCF